MDLRTCKKIIVFGGSFDPPHTAHVSLPALAREATGADAVAYVPAAVSPFKIGGRTTPAADRLAMLRLALRDEDRAAVLTDEVDRAQAGEPSYTVDTLEALHQQFGPGVEMRLLIGGDQLRRFDQWRDYDRVIALAEPLVMIRPPDTREKLLADLPAEFDRADWSTRLVDLPLVDVSSTQVRRLLAAGQPITGLVAPEVEQYIAEHHLYALSPEP